MSDLTVSDHRVSPRPAALIEVDDLVVEYHDNRGRARRAVDGVSFALAGGTSYGLVGESGSGKTTTARALLQLQPIHSGDVRLNGQSIRGLSPQRLRMLRADLQFIYQDPRSSLDGRMTASQLIEESLVIHRRDMSRSQRLERVRVLLDSVGLGAEHLDARPGGLSGGQLQRVAIARALAPEPQLLVCDEIVSALDVSVQAQILNLLRDLQLQLGLTMLFISHDLGVVSYLCDEVGVMYEGRLIETGDAETVLSHPQQDYTQQLLRASPRPNPQAERSARATRLAVEDVA